MQGSTQERTQLVLAVVTKYSGSVALTNSAVVGRRGVSGLFLLAVIVEL